MSISGWCRRLWGWFTRSRRGPSAARQARVDSTSRLDAAYQRWGHPGRPEPLETDIDDALGGPR